MILYSELRNKVSYAFPDSHPVAGIYGSLVSLCQKQKGSAADAAG